MSYRHIRNNSYYSRRPRHKSYHSSHSNKRISNNNTNVQYKVPLPYINNNFPNNSISDQVLLDFNGNKFHSLSLPSLEPEEYKFMHSKTFPRINNVSTKTIETRILTHNSQVFNQPSFKKRRISETQLTDNENEDSDSKQSELPILQEFIRQKSNVKHANTKTMKRSIIKKEKTKRKKTNIKRRTRKHRKHRKHKIKKQHSFPSSNCMSAVADMMEENSCVFDRFAVRVHFSENFGEELYSMMEYNNRPIAGHTIQSQIKFLQCPGIRSEDLREKIDENQWFPSRNNRTKDLENWKEFRELKAYEERASGGYIRWIYEEDVSIGDIQRDLITCHSELGYVKSWKLVMRDCDQSIGKSTLLSDLIEDKSTYNVENDDDGKICCFSFDVLLEQTGGWM